MIYNYKHIMFCKTLSKVICTDRHIDMSNIAHSDGPDC
jgi:hypothetical protein